MDFVIFVISMATLIWGADTLIKQSETIALRFHISEFIIGTTLIALGTSLPEMAASVVASLNHKADMAVANVIGSNILNISLVLGSVFLISKNINPNRDFFAKDSTWAMVPVFVFLLMIIDGTISRFDGILLLTLMGAYILFLVTDNKESIELDDIDEIDMAHFSWAKTILLSIVGLILIIIGAHFSVESASEIARSFGVSEWIIGIVMISFGTSLPELVVSISAAIRGKVDMAIGNIIGSNMANTSVVLGSAALANPLTIDPKAYLFDLASLLFITLLLIFITANKLYNKSAGISLLIMLSLFLNHTVQNL
jgi:cation:H+ antiporter